MNDEHLKTLTNLLTQMERGRFSTSDERSALTAILEELRESRELLEAANKITLKVKLPDATDGTVSLYRMETSDGDKWWPANAPGATKFEFDSALDAFAEVKKQGESR